MGQSMEHRAYQYEWTPRCDTNQILPLPAKSENTGVKAIMIVNRVRTRKIPIKRKKNLSIVYTSYGRNEIEAKHSQELPGLTCTARKYSPHEISSGDYLLAPSAMDNNTKDIFLSSCTLCMNSDLSLDAPYQGAGTRRNIQVGKG
jgi:hypothetical protein